MARQQSEGPVGLIKLGLDQTETVGSGAMDGEEIGVVGLVAGVRRQAVLPGREWVDDPCFKLS